LLPTNVEWSGGADLEILDIRAGILSKMNNLDAALADARKMLMLDKTYMPGYFRTGRILESIDKRKLALEVFERGVGYTSQTGADLRSICTKEAFAMLVKAMFGMTVAKNDMQNSSRT